MALGRNLLAYGLIVFSQGDIKKDGKPSITRSIRVICMGIKGKGRLNITHSGYKNGIQRFYKEHPGGFRYIVHHSAPLGNNILKHGKIGISSTSCAV